MLHDVSSSTGQLPSLYRVQYPVQQISEVPCGQDGRMAVYPIRPPNPEARALAVRRVTVMNVSWNKKFDRGSLKVIFSKASSDGFVHDIV